MNRLAHEPSPYLQQHAGNPVDWFPWGPEALERARREDKPILLSVGYSACHWCHVMAHESFEDPATAALMNEHFINIKVDREERPDVDHLYQGVVQLMGRGGGWPLTVFLTPELKPFYGGTYFPPSPRHGLPAFSALLAGIGEAWKKERAELEDQGRVFHDGLAEYAAMGLGDVAARLSTAELIEAGAKLAARVDPVHGGFGRHGPKFPNPMLLALMLRAWRRSGDRACLDATLLTLEKMARGGVFDQLGGGFHRYSVDERWAVPHFEKMAYDTAQLLHLYAEAWLIAPRPLWRDVVERSVEWLERELTSADGGFFAAQDADSEGEEGRFFVWRPEEVRALLPADDAALVLAHYGLTAEGNFEHGATVLAATSSVSDADRPRLERARRTLFEARQRRVAPGRDDKILVGWNGLLIRGLAYAARVFSRPDWARLATRAADHLAAKAVRPDGTLARSLQQGAARGDGLLEDYGDLALGLVTLFQATGEARHLERAAALAELAHARFWDDERRAWLAAPKGTSDLLVPTFALHDNAFPSGASTLTEAQLVLTALTGQPRHLERATAFLERMHDELVRNPMGYGHLWLAADLLLDGTPELTLVGDAAWVSAARAKVDATWLPTVSVLPHVIGQPPPAPAHELLASRTARGAYLCQHFACQRPVTTLDELTTLIAPLTAR
ncbi:MAG: thioredoxin domain-containing protein [Myxococcota bacterium]